MATSGNIKGNGNYKGRPKVKKSKLKNADIVEILEDFYVKPPKGSTFNKGKEKLIKAGSDPSEAPDFVNWDFLARRNTVKAKK
tara:strand:- start:817 stop:1065 length:249 start_codon:yes stop_codon:yes gene_type:complete